MKRERRFLFGITAGVIGGLLCSSLLFAGGLSDATVKEAAKLVTERKGDSAFVILDVRTPEEFTEGHLEGALNIDVKSDGFRDEVSKLEKEKTYLVYCRSGKRSKAAQRIMGEAGFKDVANMKGGFMGWAKEGLPYEK